MSEDKIVQVTFTVVVPSELSGQELCTYLTDKLWQDPEFYNLVDLDQVTDIKENT